LSIRLVQIPRLTADGADAGKWFMETLEPGRAGGRRAGYCARDCAGHGSREEALAHHRQYQLDQEVELGLERRSSPSACEICGETTTLRAQVGGVQPWFVLCWVHQTIPSLRDAVRRRTAVDVAAQAAATATVESAVSSPQ